MLKNFKIGTRLSAAFGAVLVLMVVMTAVGMNGVNRLGTALQSMYDDRVVALAELGELNRLINRNRILVMDMMAYPTPANIERRNTEYSTNVEKGTAVLKAYMATGMLEEEKRRPKSSSLHAKLFSPKDRGLPATPSSLATPKLPPSCTPTSSRSWPRPPRRPWQS